jgi:hypothetical protein
MPNMIYEINMANEAIEADVITSFEAKTMARWLYGAIANMGGHSSYDLCNEGICALWEKATGSAPTQHDLLTDRNDDLGRFIYKHMLAGQLAT